MDRKFISTIELKERIKDAENEIKKYKKELQRRMEKRKIKKRR